MYKRQRVQLSSRNLPVVGDGKYGGNPAVKKAEEYHIKRGCIASVSYTHLYYTLGDNIGKFGYSVKK